MGVDADPGVAVVKPGKAIPQASMLGLALAGTVVNLDAFLDSGSLR